jgi:hypothetical protein
LMREAEVMPVPLTAAIDPKDAPLAAEEAVAETPAAEIPAPEEGI